jgi:hypothetical protein
MTSCLVKFAKQGESVLQRYQSISSTGATTTTTTPLVLVTSVVSWSIIYCIIGLVSIGIEWNLLSDCSDVKMRFSVIANIIVLIILCVLEYKAKTSENIKKLAWVFELLYLIFNCLALDGTRDSSCITSWAKLFLRISGSLAVCAFILILFSIGVYLYYKKKNPDALKNQQVSQV